MSTRGLLVHEWIESLGGAERVVDELASLHPEADVFTLWDDDPGRYRPGRVHESRLARTPLRGRKAAALPFMSQEWRRGPAALGLGPYDWAIVSSHLFAHHVAVPGVEPDRQFTYVHTPARYLWDPECDARGRSLLVRSVAWRYRGVDRRRARSLSHVAVNSEFVRDRVARTWGLEARVLHPPVDVDRMRSALLDAGALRESDRELLAGLPQDFVLGASRFVPYKRLDLAVAAGAATGRPVVVAGRGPDEQRLREAAASSGVDVRFVVAPSDAVLAHLFARAAVLVFAAVEDFGIVPVEALAVGTPVVVADRGGATETVTAATGVRLEGEDPASLRSAVEAAVLLDPEACRRRADAFSAEIFRRGLREWTGF